MKGKLYMILAASFIGCAGQGEATHSTDYRDYDLRKPVDQIVEETLKVNPNKQSEPSVNLGDYVTADGKVGNIYQDRINDARAAAMERLRAQYPSIRDQKELVEKAKQRLYDDPERMRKFWSGELSPTDPTYLWVFEEFGEDPNLRD